MNSCVLDAALQVLQADTTLPTQVAVVAMHMLLWHFIFEPCHGLLQPWFLSRAWLEGTLLRADAGFRKYGVSYPREHLVAECVNYVLVGMQHTAGGCCCIPAVLGLWPSHSSALVRHGALIEVAWEIMDSAKRLWMRATHTEGRNRQPRLVLLGLACHHVMGTGMGIPMNLHFSTEYHYALLVCMMQFAAGVGMLTMIYSYTLDVKRRADLVQARWLSIACFTVMFVTRGPMFCWSVVKLILSAHSCGALKCTVGGAVSALFMVGTNVALIYEAARRVVKFWRRSPADEGAEAEDPKAEDPKAAPAPGAQAQQPGCSARRRVTEG